MSERMPLSALLSQTLVAFTIECDNEAEHRLPHSITNKGWTADTSRGPWLTSMVMWWNCLRFVSDEGVTVRELKRLARTATNLDGMRRWGYIRIESDKAEAFSKKTRLDAVLRLTAAGRLARQIWQPVFADIEKRWEVRFSPDAMDRLRVALRALVTELDPRLPDCMPILRYGLSTSGPEDDTPSAVHGDIELPLIALIAKVLTAFALEFERGSEVSLAICANVLRVVAEGRVRVRELSRLSGVSKEAIAMAVGFLEKNGYADVKAETDGAKAKALSLTSKGRLAYAIYRELPEAIEAEWQKRYGNGVVRALRGELEGLGAGAPLGNWLLSAGLKPYPENWRAAVRPQETLPHFPMVLHRGGYPDGS